MSPIQIIRKMLPYTTVATCLALIYTGWVFFARSSQNQEIRKETDQKYVEQAKKTDEMYGSGHLKILSFYAVPATVAKGAPAELCYSVANAAAVKIDHGVEAIKPSLDRCVPVRPGRSTTYTLSATDEKG